MSEQVWMNTSGELFIIRFFKDDWHDGEANQLTLNLLRMCEAECLGDL